MTSNDPKELLSPEEYEELKLEIFRERKISTEVIADIKLTEEEIQAIRKKTKERRQVIHSQTEKEITDRWAFEEGVRRSYLFNTIVWRSSLTFKNFDTILFIYIFRCSKLRCKNCMCSTSNNHYVSLTE